MPAFSLIDYRPNHCVHVEVAEVWTKCEPPKFGKVPVVRWLGFDGERSVRLDFEFGWLYFVNIAETYRGSAVARCRYERP